MNNSQVSTTTVAMIFRTFRGRFGSPFVERYRSGEVVPEGQPNAGKDTGLLEAMDVWAHELRDLSTADIEHGLKAKFKYPPSSDEFVQACCTRDYAAQPQNAQYAALPAPKMTREEASVHIAQVQSAARSMRFPTDNAKKLDWAYAIADQVERGVYRHGVMGKRMAAEAIRDSHREVPASLREFLPQQSHNNTEGAA